MRTAALRLLLASTCCSLAACATVAPAPAPVVVAPVAVAADPAPTATAESEHEKLFALFKASDEASLQRNPLNALSRGDLRYADRFGDNITDAYYAAELAADEADLAALRQIDRSKLNETDQLAYDVFEYPGEGRDPRLSARPAGADQGPADEPLLRLPHLLSDLRQRAGHGAVQDARRL